MSIKSSNAIGGNVWSPYDVAERNAQQAKRIQSIAGFSIIVLVSAILYSVYKVATYSLFDIGHVSSTDSQKFQFMRLIDNRGALWVGFILFAGVILSVSIGVYRQKVNAVFYVFPASIIVFMITLFGSTSYGLAQQLSVNEWVTSEVGAKTTIPINIDQIKSGDTFKAFNSNEEPVTVTVHISKNDVVTLTAKTATEK